MAITDAENFIAAVRNAPALRREVGALKGADALARLVAIAAREGHRFTEAEYRAAVVRQSRGELSEESLEEVARELGLRE